VGARSPAKRRNKASAPGLGRRRRGAPVVGEREGGKTSRQPRVDAADGRGMNAPVFLLSW